MPQPHYKYAPNLNPYLMKVPKPLSNNVSLSVGNEYLGGLPSTNKILSGLRQKKKVWIPGGNTISMHVKPNSMITKKFYM